MFQSATTIQKERKKNTDCRFEPRSARNRQSIRSQLSSRLFRPHQSFRPPNPFINCVTFNLKKKKKKQKRIRNKFFLKDILYPGPHHFPETSFHRIVVLPKRHIVECQLVESSDCRIVKLPDLYNVKCYFIESVFSRTSFSRYIV